MKKLAAALALTLFSVMAMAAEEFTLWTSETFVGPYTDGVIAVSSEINNNSGLPSVEVVIEYEAFSPDRDAGESADFRVNAILEQQIGTKWYPAAYQYSHINKLSDAPKRVMVMDPSIKESSENFLYVGFENIAAQTFNPGTLADKFRVKLIVDNSGTYPLTSITVSGYGRKTGG